MDVPLPHILDLRALPIEFSINATVALAQSTDPGYSGLRPILPSTKAMPTIPDEASMTHDDYRSLTLLDNETTKPLEASVTIHLEQRPVRQSLLLKLLVAGRLPDFRCK